jgi:hypothetical protein
VDRTASTRESLKHCHRAVDLQDTGGNVGRPRCRIFGVNACPRRKIPKVAADLPRTFASHLADEA